MDRIALVLVGLLLVGSAQAIAPLPPPGCTKGGGFVNVLQGVLENGETHASNSCVGLCFGLGLSFSRTDSVLLLVTGMQQGDIVVFRGRGFPSEIVVAGTPPHAWGHAEASDPGVCPDFEVEARTVAEPVHWSAVACDEAVPCDLAFAAFAAR